MSNSWTTFGHDITKSILQKQLAASHFPHAYLFTGPEGIGKRTLALEFAGKLLGTDAPLNHSDFQMLSGEVSAEEVREFISRLAVKPFSARYTVAILDDVHKLNLASSNALLKTLEEPSPTTILLLIAGTSGLLPTVVSRCQVFTFNPFTEIQLNNYWQQHENSEASNGALLLAGGSISKLKLYIEQPETATTLNDQLSELERLVGSSVFERLLAVDKFAALETEDLLKLLENFLFRLRGQLVAAPIKASLMQSVLAAHLALRSYMNKKLVLERLFLSYE